MCPGPRACWGLGASQFVVTFFTYKNRNFNRLYYTNRATDQDSDEPEAIPSIECTHLSIISFLEYCVVVRLGQVFPSVAYEHNRIYLLDLLLRGLSTIPCGLLSLRESGNRISRTNRVYSLG